MIPASRFDKIGQQLMNWYPVPNLPGLANDYTRNVPLLQTNKNAVFRGDIQVSAKDSMFVRANIIRFSENANVVLLLPANDPSDRLINSEGRGSALEGLSVRAPEHEPSRETTMLAGHASTVSSTRKSVSVRRLGARRP